MADDPRTDPRSKLSRFGEALVRHADEVPKGFRKEAEKKVDEAKRAADELVEKVRGSAQELSRFRADRVDAFGKALARRAKDLPATVAGEAKKQIVERVAAAKQVASDVRTAVDSKAKEDARFAAAGRILKKGFEELAARSAPGKATHPRDLVRDIQQAEEAMARLPAGSREWKQHEKIKNDRVGTLGRQEYQGGKIQENVVHGPATFLRVGQSPNSMWWTRAEDFEVAIARDRTFDERIIREQAAIPKEYQKSMLPGRDMRVRTQDGVEVPNADNPKGHNVHLLHVPEGQSVRVFEGPAKGKQDESEGRFLAGGGHQVCIPEYERRRGSIFSAYGEIHDPRQRIHHDGFDDVRKRLVATKDVLDRGPSKRLRQVTPPGEGTGPVAENDFWRAMHAHGGDWDRVRSAYVRSPASLAGLEAERRAHQDDLWKTLRKYDGSWDRLRDDLLTNDPQRLGVLAATRKETIDDCIRHAGVGRKDREVIRGTQQSRKPTSDDDVTALHPEQASAIERSLHAKMEAEGIRHGDTAKALDCNVYTEFRSERFDRRVHGVDYKRDARRELALGYVGVLRDGGAPGEAAVRARELALVRHRGEIERSAHAGRLAPDEAKRRLEGVDLHQAAIADGREFYAKHLAGKKPAEIAAAREAARADLAKDWHVGPASDPAEKHRLNEKAALVRALETDSSTSRGGFHSNVSIGQKPKGSAKLDPADHMTAELEHMRGYYKAREHDTPQARQKAGKYLERMRVDAHALQQSQPQSLVERGRHEAERSAAARAAGRPRGSEDDVLHGGINMLKAGRPPTPEQEHAIRNWMQDLDRRAIEADPLRAKRHAPVPVAEPRVIEVERVDAAPRQPGGTAAATGPAGPSGPPSSPPQSPPVVSGEESKGGAETQGRPDAVRAAKQKSAKLEQSKSMAPAREKAESK